MNVDKKTQGYLMVAVAGSLWGFLGLLGKILFHYQLSSQAVGLSRLFSGFILLFLYLSLKNPQLLKIDKKGLIHVAFLGLFSQALFNLFYFRAIEATSITTAVILLYTSPIFVMILSRIFYKELLTPFKIISLFLCIIGCFLTVTGGRVDALKMNLSGILVGIGAGFCYALMPIISKSIVDKYNSWTIVFYNFVFGFLFLLPFSNPLEVLQVGFDIKIWLLFICLGLITSILPYSLYVTGLSFGIESSKASIICTLEVVVSVIISYFVFHEALGFWKLTGILLVLSSVIVLQRDTGLLSKRKELSSDKAA